MASLPWLPASAPPSITNAGARWRSKEFSTSSPALVVMWPGLTLVAFIYMAAFWALVSGIALLVAAFRLHRQHGEWMMILAGLLSIAWGILVVLFPIAGILIWAWWIGAYALVFGIAVLALAFRLRRHHPG